MLNKKLFTSNSVEYSTPINFFNKVDSEFHFTLDVCSSDLNYKCVNHYTLKDNGLIQSWADNVVWCNPPYGKHIIDWCIKCFTEWAVNNITIVMLLPVRTDTKWFQTYIYPFCELRFIKGRLKFNEWNYAPFPSMLCIFNKRIDSSLPIIKKDIINYEECKKNGKC